MKSRVRQKLKTQRKEGRKETKRKEQTKEEVARDTSSERCNISALEVAPFRVKCQHQMLPAANQHNKGGRPLLYPEARQQSTVLRSLIYTHTPS